MKRIVITGAESTGKSTLAKALSDYYAEPYSREFVRSYVDSHQRELNPSDLKPIATGQLALEDAELEQAQRLIFHDTNILSSMIYAEVYFDTAIDWVNDRFLERDYSLYLLCMPDIPWQADEGQRESPAARDDLHLHFKHSSTAANSPTSKSTAANKRASARPCAPSTRFYKGVRATRPQHKCHVGDSPSTLVDVGGSPTLLLFPPLKRMS